MQPHEKPVKLQMDKVLACLLIQADYGKKPRRGASCRSGPADLAEWR